MTDPGTRAGARTTLRPLVFLGVLSAALIAGPGIVTAAPASDIPQRLSDLTAEQASWRDAGGVIWCSEHTQFPGCGESPFDIGYRYPEDNALYLVQVRNGGFAR